MILGTTMESPRYESLHPDFKIVFDYVRSNFFKPIPTGRITLRGTDVFINVDEVEMRTKEQQLLEIHQKYIDIHFPLSGEEIVGWTPDYMLKTDSLTPFDTKRDYAFYKEPASTYFTVRPGQFYIMYPEDAHAPIIGQGKMRKFVAKVRMRM